jgi:cell division protein ZapA (FtsZ GTPase activity inhibitor)
MDEKLSIRVNIGERFYPLKIERNEEEKIRKAAKTINDKLLQYKQKYAEKDIQDFLAMVSLQYVTKVFESEMEKEDSSILEEIKDLNEGLEEYLQNQ